MEQKHFCTQTLFSKQTKPVAALLKTDDRHAEDSKKGFMTYYVEGDSEPRSEAQGLRHDCMVWNVRGHPQVPITWPLFM